MLSPLGGRGKCVRAADQHRTDRCRAQDKRPLVVHILHYLLHTSGYRDPYEVRYTMHIQYTRYTMHIHCILCISTVSDKCVT